MAHKFAEIAFTPTVRSLQSEAGSRESYARFDTGHDYNQVIGEREASFIAARDSFYMASVSETGWPYLQHRGGPAGFMKCLGERSIGFADYSGNRQYLSTGNFRNDDRVALFFMDYPKRRRLKLLGRVRRVGEDEPELLARLEDRHYPAQVERGFVIEVAGFDWNCPQHITPRFTTEELDEQLAGLRTENNRLENLLDGASSDALPGQHREPRVPQEALGDGPLALVVTGLRQLAPRVRAFEFRDPAGRALPAVEAGAHLRLPVRLASGELVERHYSIASNPARRDVYEIAVLREEAGSGGSAAVHDSYCIGTRLNVDMPVNHFSLHADERPALLIAGGIGITPIKSIAQALDERGADFRLHYAGHSRAEMAFRDRLERQFGHRLAIYSGADGERLDIDATLAAAPANSLIYLCGPRRLTIAVRDSARKLGIAPDRLRLELFD